MSPSADYDAACTCTYYVVDYSDPERYHPENVDREEDPACPVHSVLPPDLGDDPDGDLDEIEGIAAARAAGYGYQPNRDIPPDRT